MNEVTSNVFSFLRAFAGEDLPAHAAPSAPLTYQDFVNLLRQPAAADVVHYIKAFVYKTLKEEVVEIEGDVWAGEDRHPGDAEPFAAQVKSFLADLETRLSRHPLWRACSQREWTNALEGCEKFVMHKIYPRVFAPTLAHKARDAALAARLIALKGLTPAQLEVAPDLALLGSAWQVAGEELCKMDDFRAPKDKLVCVMNCCRIIGDVLSAQHSGADAFLPVLLLVVLRSNPPRLHSNVEYVAAYRGSQLSSSQQTYFLTQLASAVAFFWTATPETFGLSPEDFAKLAEISNGSDEEAQAWLPPPPGQALDLWTAQRFRFANIKAEDLKVAEVTALLHEYKLVVGACKSLLAAARGAQNGEGGGGDTSAFSVGATDDHASAVEGGNIQL